MDVREKLTRATELLQQRDTIDAELRSIFGEVVDHPAKQRKCSKCGQTGHQARACTAGPAVQE